MNYLRRLRKSNETQINSKIIKIGYWLSFIVAIFLGINLGANHYTKPKKPVKKPVGRNAVDVCAPQAIPKGTEYIFDSSTIYSYWKVTCVTGKIQVPCTLSMQMIINKNDSNGGWKYVDETCVPLTFDCGYSGPASWWWRGIPQQYGLSNVYRVTFRLWAGSCNNQGVKLGEIISEPFFYTPPIGA